ncbi:rRNA methyltransferase 1 [Yarrowia sp. C11]|nr:rRNA methyltransferase 1 [Yarrowia sp. E02]KAG5371419.1 rRNA methyltransferase 1 [Yarrowia sp. C11]
MAFKNMKNLPRPRFARSSKPRMPGPARTFQPVFKGKKFVHKTPLYNTFPHVEPKPWEAKNMSRDDYYRDLARKRKLDEDQAKNRMLNQQRKQQMIQEKYLNNDEYDLIEETDKKNKKPASKSDDEFLTADSLTELGSKPQKVYIVKKENPREKGGAIFRNRQSYDKPKLDERFFGQDVLYGTHAVEACLTSHKRRNQCLKLFVAEGKLGEPVVKKIMDMARKLRIPIENVDRNTLNLITKHSIHNGVALVTKPLELDEILELEPFTKANIGQSIFVKTMRHGVVISEPASYLFSEEERMNSLEEVEQVEEATEEAATEVADLVNDASESVKPKETVAEKISEVKEDVKETVSEVKESVVEAAEKAKETVEETIKTVIKPTEPKDESTVKSNETQSEIATKPTETDFEATTETSSEVPLEAEDLEELDLSPITPTFQVTSSVESHRPRRFPLVIYLDQLNDTHNLGSILRSCQFLGADAVVITAKNCAPLSPAVAKTSSGALEYMPVFENSKTPANFFQKCKKNGWNIVCAAVPTAAGAAKTKAEKPLSLRQCGSWLDNKPTVLVLGGEHGGVRQTILNQADHHVIVPASNSWIKNNTVDSLNVGVAAGILINRFVVI